MAALRDDVKLFIVHALACFDTPTEVAKAVKEEFEIDVPRQQIAVYDPTKYNGRQLSKKLKTHFEDTRAKFRDQVSEIPIAQRAFRLRSLSRMATRSEARGNIALAVQIIEQAAKEVGDVFVNHRLDPIKTPGAGGEQIPSAPEYVLKPDEDVPAKPIL